MEKSGRKGRPTLPKTQLELFAVDVITSAFDPTIAAMRDSINAQITAYNEIVKRRALFRDLAAETVAA